jgi:hypothetical protein
VLFDDLHQRLPPLPLQWLKEAEKNLMKTTPAPFIPYSPIAISKISDMTADYEIMEGLKSTVSQNNKRSELGCLSF